MSIDIITTKLQLKTNNVLRFNEKLFFNTILGLSPNWDYKLNNEYISRNQLDITTIDKIYLKCDCIYGSILNGIRANTLYLWVRQAPWFQNCF